MTTKPAPTNARKLFVNLPVRDLQRSKQFFAALGFEFNPRFTDEKAACMVLNEEAYVMLLVEPFFRTFDKREICDTTSHTEALLAISCASRAEVDDIVKRAVAVGGSTPDSPKDHGFMYDWSFYDLDGHGWGVFWMDPAGVQ
jgi:predicted lactoylglutathione lyase